jgi:cytochrome P450
MPVASAGELNPVPSHIPADLIRDFDFITGEGMLTDPFRTLDELFNGPPIVWSSQWGGYWIFSGMEVIREALQTSDLFSNNSSGIPQRSGGLFGPRPMIPEQIDPPDHAKYRRLLAPFFAPSAVEAMTASVRGTCRELIEALAPKGACDFLRDYAQPLPTRVFLSLMGLPRDRADVFRGWVHDLLYRSGDHEVRLEAGLEVRAYLEQTVAERSAHPGTDLISTLLAATVDGRAVTVEEAYDTAILLFLAGLDTVTAALASPGTIWPLIPRCEHGLWSTSR